MKTKQIFRGEDDQHKRLLQCPEEEGKIKIGEDCKRFTPNPQLFSTHTHTHMYLPAQNAPFTALTRFNGKTALDDQVGLEKKNSYKS